MKAFLDNQVAGINAIIGKSISLKEIEKDMHYRVYLKGWRELNTLLQGYRNKKYETFRYILIDKTGKIVDQLEITSKMPNFCNVSEKNDKTLKEVISRLEVENLWLIVSHNHPSGNVQASSFDTELTESLERSLKRNDGCQKFLGHIIMEFSQFNYWTPEHHHWQIKDVLKVAEYDPILNADFEERYIGGTTALKEIATEFHNADSIPVIFTNADRNVSGYKDYQFSFFERDPSEVRKDLIKDSVDFGAIGAFPIFTPEFMKDKNSADIKLLLKNHITYDAFTDAAIEWSTITEMYDIEAGRNYYSFFRDNSDRKIEVTSTWDRVINPRLFPPED